MEVKRLGVEVGQRFTIVEIDRTIVAVARNAILKVWRYLRENRYTVRSGYALY